MKPKKVRRCPACKWIGTGMAYCRDSRDACTGHCPVCRDQDIILPLVTELEAAVWRGQQEEGKLK
jgi:hypothetical protein